MDKQELEEQLKKAEQLHDKSKSIYRRERFAEACWNLRKKLEELEEKEDEQKDEWQKV